MNIYISFGQAHKHLIDEILFDKDILAEVIDREHAFKLFGPVFSMSYDSTEDKMQHFPRGTVVAPQPAERMRLYAYVRGYMAEGMMVRVVDQKGIEVGTHCARELWEVQQYAGFTYSRTAVWHEYHELYPLGWQLEWVDGPEYHHELKGILDV